jgi:hypothetical protein
LELPLPPAPLPLLGRLQDAYEERSSSSESSMLSEAMMELAEALVVRLQQQVLGPALESPEYAQLERRVDEL